MTSQQIIMVLKALADEHRLRIVRELSGGNCGEVVKSTCEVLACQSMSQPTVSHHLAKLVAAGVLVEQKSGTQKSYRVDSEMLMELGIDVSKM